MTKLDQVIADAHQLSPDEQEKLASVVSAFLANLAEWDSSDF